MRVTKAKAAEHRGSIVEAASRLFREAGPGGVGVAEVTRAAGLTHGSFYRQFGSKEALFAEACELALRDNAVGLAEALAQPDGIARYAAQYLNEAHVAGRGGCPIANLGADVARQGMEAQAAFARGLRAFLACERAVNVGDAAWRGTTADLATMVGALLMARAVASADGALSQAIVAAALEKLNVA